MTPRDDESASERHVGGDNGFTWRWEPTPEQTRALERLRDAQVAPPTVAWDMVMRCVLIVLASMALWALGALVVIEVKYR